MHPRKRVQNPQHTNSDTVKAHLKNKSFLNEPVGEESLSFVDNNDQC